MLFHTAVLPVFFLLSAVATPSSAQSTTNFTKQPGCQSRCGNLQVPYPFGIGIGSNCSLNSGFDIRCDASSNPPKAYLASSSFFEIINISETQIYVKDQIQQMAAACYGVNSSRNAFTNRSIDISISQSAPYTLSDENQVLSIGCDDLATLQGISNIRSVFGGGCVSYCPRPEDSGGVGSCPTNGCCRASIPKGQGSLAVYMSDLHKNWRGGKLFRCSFAFIGVIDSHNFTFNLSDLNDSTTFLNNYPRLTSVPLLLDWRIVGSQNCREARNSGNYSCQANSNCTDFDAAIYGGYRCHCNEGYEGNPYLSPGCHDINECDLDPCASNGICRNSPGSYSCSCPDGYYGDGQKRGIGCLKVPGPDPTRSSVRIGAILIAGVGLLILVFACIWLYKFLKKRRIRKQKEKFFKRNGGLLLQQQMSTNEYLLERTKLFTAKDLDKATDHFNQSRILGQGGFGTVYKGMLSDGKLAAIKKSKLEDENQVVQFINEVVILSQISHRNIVKLLGCCLETEVPLLVYEFIPNGTLFDLIHDNSGDFPFTWNMRLKIAVEVAGALAHLHYASSVPIYHRDIKSSNVLLDERYVAKVADFGTSRSIAVDQTHLTTLVKGTFGYLDPEYFQSSQFTEKSDVYSFGVVLVELLTGQRPISKDRNEEERGLATRFLLCMEGNNLETILDSQVVEQGKRDELIVVAKLAQRCLNLSGRNRPTMKEVAMELENVRVSQAVGTAAENNVQGIKFRSAKSAMLSDDDYRWTTSTADSTVSASDSYPLMINTV